MSSTVPSFGPALKLYGATAGPVRPYLWTALNAVFTGSSSTTDGEFPVDAGQRDRTVGGQAGLGLEWSPHPRVSIGGHAGVAAGFGRTRFISDGDEVDPSVHTSFVNTFHSGIRVQFYF